jgi:hypothetical protein
MFLIAYSQTMFYAKYEYIGMYIIYLHTKFHMCGSNGSLVTALKPKAKEIFHTTISLFYILKENFNKSFIFF